MNCGMSDILKAFVKKNCYVVPLQLGTSINENYSPTKSQSIELMQELQRSPSNFVYLWERGDGAALQQGHITVHLHRVTPVTDRRERMQKWQNRFIISKVVMYSANSIDEIGINVK